MACFKYATINLYSVAVPPPQIEFHNPKQQGWLLKESAEVCRSWQIVSTSGVGDGLILYFVCWVHCTFIFVCLGFLNSGLLSEFFCFDELSFSLRVPNRSRISQIYCSQKSSTL